ncbi:MULTISPECIES: metal ABC transporter ATP-binding protein [Aerococcus]|uniref:metal ABC transporter ATP-binding protein n=1 Tax=Aerococcus TaxID=1375 RepID=UPI000DCE3A0D|nr:MULTISPECIES: metal ABC transporter ATP-binding protein [Aerococcus]KAA9218383.1 metal ABC transporter ATP-binding protein [Aerococcus loyolae]KAA9266942.1 metal ABC transporter ATP-binding protein [Aerococcus loyolae]MDK6231813.1 metal ABC transporter ATP-binding protein [Aerococcus urinae]MDK6257942.1 metal ABC transporter ATP-binding protein [Aerococcus urinae]MDK6293090.1 metal ABC transporter ATP-binding protein [Aerococcus urinae]
MHYIQVEDLRFSYDSEPVLNNISFTVDPGEFVILTGENGAAKSTLLKNILGLLQPDKGKVTISKTNIYDNKLQIGYVPQMVASFNAGFPSTVYEFVLSGRYQQGRWFKRLTDEDHEHVKRALNSVGMWEQAQEKVGELSGGQKQRIVLARVFATDPDLFVLDEPTTGMDKASREEFYTLLKHNTRRHCKAILMVTHEDIHLQDYFDKHIHLTREEGSPWRCFSMTSWPEPSSPVEP